jgi:hypothetical protein
MSHISGKEFLFHAHAEFKRLPQVLRRCNRLGLPVPFEAVGGKQLFDHLDMIFLLGDHHL